MSKQSAYSGGEANRTGEPLDGFGGRLDGWTQGAGAPARPAPAAPTNERETDAGDDDTDAEHPLSGIDGETAQNYVAMLRSGAVTPESLRDNHGLSDAAIAELQEAAGVAQPARSPAAPRKSIEQRLAEIKVLRKEDPKAYWSQEIQAEELRLLGLQLDGKGREIERQVEADTKAKDDADEPAGDDELQAVRDELAELKAKRKARTFTEEDEAREGELLSRQEILSLGAQDLDPHLIATWRESGGLKANLEKARATANAVRAELGDEGYAALAEAVDALSDQARSAIFDALRLDPIPVRGNSEDERIDAAAEVIATALPDDISEAELQQFIKAIEALDGNAVYAITRALTR